MDKRTYKVMLEEAHEITADSFARAISFCKERSIPAKFRVEYAKLLVNASIRNYAAAAQREILQEIADSLSDVARAIAFKAAEDEEALQKLEE
jgi:hypothetical protein